MRAIPKNARCFGRGKALRRADYYPAPERTAERTRDSLSLLQTKTIIQGEAGGYGGHTDFVPVAGAPGAMPLGKSRLKWK
jgi:hypothetical protein